jgi:hypothetical protein
MEPENYAAIRDRLFDRFHRGGEQLKNDLPNILRTAIVTEAWKAFRDPNGRAFENLVEWLMASYPIGPAMGGGRHVISYNDALQLCADASDVRRVLAAHPPWDIHPRANDVVDRVERALAEYHRTLVLDHDARAMKLIGCLTDEGIYVCTVLRGPVSTD